MTHKIRGALLYCGLALCAFAAGLYAYNAVQYDFKTLDNKTYKHSDLEGYVLVVNYFAEWCAPCLREIPELNEFYHQAPDKVKLFAISFDTLSDEKLAALQKKYEIKFPLISELVTEFAFDKPQYLPATFIIKSNGEVAGQLLGEQTSATLNEVILSL